MQSCVLLGLCLYLLTSRVEGSVECYECKDMPHPSDCELATTCTGFEQCFVEQVVSTGGLILYNSGCRAKTRCAVAGKRDVRDYVTSLKKRVEPDIVVCSECCDGNFCNDNGCGQLAVRYPQRGLKCYNCKDLINTAECRDLTICQDPSEICMVHEFVGPDNHPRYESKCERSLVCNALSHIQVSQCVRCCNSDVCNNVCNGTSTTSGAGGSSTGSIGGVTTRMPNPQTTPSTPPPTTPTTRPTTPGTTLKPQDFCQLDGYLYIGFIPICFKIHKEHKTRAEAEHLCQTEQGQLAVIDSERKWDFVGKVYSQTTFTGARQFYVDGKYDTHQNSFICDGNAPCTFHQWAANMPARPASKRCLYLDGYDSMKWYNGDCSEQKMFICTKRV